MPDAGRQISRKLTAAGVEIKGAQRTSVLRSGREMAKAIQGGAPARLRNVGKRGAALSVKVTARDSGSFSSAEVRAVGPWQILNNPARPHLIFRKNARARGRGARQVNRQAAYNELFGGAGAYRGGNLRLPDGGFRRVVQHPGHGGKQLWQKGLERALTPAKDSIRKALADAASRGFGR